MKPFGREKRALAVFTAGVGALVMISCSRSTVSSASPQLQDGNRSAVVTSAEKFIRLAGYLSDEPDKDVVANDEPALVTSRRRSLCPRAYGVAHPFPRGGSGYGVVFKFTRQYLARHHMVEERDRIGFVLMLDASGQNPRSVDESFLLSKVDDVLGGECEM
jgi:hypothetical protein